MNSQESDIFIGCYPFLEPYVKKEVAGLGFKNVEIKGKGVHLKGSFGDTMKLNLNLRTANKVLYSIASFECKDGEELYMKAVKLPWEKIMDSSGYFSIDSFVRNSSINDNRYANLKLKDAIVDRFYLKTNVRPNSGAEKDKTVFYMHWNESQCTLYLDTSGETLAKHGYREGNHPAPMSEALAAANLLAAGWDRRSSLVNPMCGSGTLAIEAAMIHIGKPPGLLRHNFGFMHSKWFDANYWRNLRNDAFLKVFKESRISIIATDHDPEALKAARASAKNAGVAKFIEFRKCDFYDTEIPEKKGLVIMNPEYGERMGSNDDLVGTYSKIGAYLKNKCKGFKAGIFTGNLGLLNEVYLKPYKKIKMLNGKIECRLALYEMY